MRSAIESLEKRLGESPVQSSELANLLNMTILCLKDLDLRVKDLEACHKIELELERFKRIKANMQ